MHSTPARNPRLQFPSKAVCFVCMRRPALPLPAQAHRTLHTNLASVAAELAGHRDSYKAAIKEVGADRPGLQLGGVACGDMWGRGHVTCEGGVLRVM